MSVRGNDEQSPPSHRACACPWIPTCAAIGNNRRGNNKSGIINDGENDGELTNKRNFFKKDLDFKSNFEYDINQIWYLSKNYFWLIIT